MPRKIDYRPGNHLSGERTAPLTRYADMLQVRLPPKLRNKILQLRHGINHKRNIQGVIFPDRRSAGDATLSTPKFHGLNRWRFTMIAWTAARQMDDHIPISAPVPQLFRTALRVFPGKENHRVSACR